MPSPDTSKLKEIARRLRAFEASAAGAGAAKNPTAFRVCDRLGSPLGKVLGTDGFRALLSRALTLSAAQVPWLGGLHVNSDGTVEGSETNEPKTKRDAAALAEAEIAVVAELLGLLVTFIGPALTLRLLRDIWPKLDDLDF